MINWGSVADWVSGVGSLSAVVTALYLASDTKRIKLWGYCGIRLVVGAGGPQQELVFLSVTNVGSRTATVSNIGMRVGLLKKRVAVISAAKDLYSDGVPLSLADGEVAKWGIPLTADKKWIKELVDGFIKEKSDIASLRFFVQTTERTMKLIKPEQPLKDEIRKALEAKNA